LEINESNVEKLVDIIASLEPTFEGINLEDIKAPDCFLIKKAQRAFKDPGFSRRPAWNSHYHDNRCFKWLKIGEEIH